MNNIRISALLLERYHIGEVTDDEKRFVEEAAAKDGIVAAEIADIFRADIDFRRRFPKDIFFSKDKNFINDNNKPSIFSPRRKTSFMGRGFPLPAAKFPVQRQIKKMPAALIWGFSAAAVMLIIAIPLLILNNSAQTEFGDRIKGKSASEPFTSAFSNDIADNASVELSVYIRGNTAGEGIRLADHSGVREGNTVQLVYRISEENTNAKYGVIFSIDGRSQVTLHYPYNAWQNTQLVSGRNVPLDEAYTLDDAPNYEIFFFVTGNTPIDAEKILTSANELAEQIEGQLNEAERLGSVLFSGYNVKAFTLIKE